MRMSMTLHACWAVRAGCSLRPPGDGVCPARSRSLTRSSGLAWSGVVTSNPTWISRAAARRRGSRAPQSAASLRRSEACFLPACRRLTPSFSGLRFSFPLTASGLLPSPTSGFPPATSGLPWRLGTYLLWRASMMATLGVEDPDSQERHNENDCSIFIWTLDKRNCIGRNGFMA